MFKAYHEKLLVQLAVDFNSTPQDLKAKETIITTPELNDGEGVTALVNHSCKWQHLGRARLLWQMNVCISFCKV